MFIDFFFYLRRSGLGVSITEWLMLMDALVSGYAGESMLRFYYLCRGLCVKHEGKFDLYDQAFAGWFKGIEAPAGVKEELIEWLKDAKLPKQLSPEEMKRLASLGLDELRRLFEERMAEQKGRHDGGSRWIGTGGTSPFGHSGQHPSGIRVGGDSYSRMAMQVASKRIFRNLRSDRTLDTRQIGVALKQLRQLARIGINEELDLDATIASTCKNAGEITLEYRPERRNSVKLLLLMDVGGSMTMYTRLCEQLFSAARSVHHFKELRFLYFHNCPYEFLFDDIEKLGTISTPDVLRDLDSNWYLMMVGDAAMNPYELTVPGGCIDYFHHNEEPGLLWLARLRERFPKSIWLNPTPPNWWNIASGQLVRRVFPEMYALSVAGIEQAVATLKQKTV